jgi:hypothetical protein
MVQAARLSLRPASDFSLFQAALDAYPRQGDPLWPALARHITRNPSLDDRALLEEIAQAPARRKPPLSWGLQYIVRGDIVLSDGSFVRLDELCDTLDLPHLPYLEDLPNEPEGDFPLEPSKEPFPSEIKVENPSSEPISFR